MRLIFIRHGQTDVNTQGLTHRTDDKTGLNNEGKKQIESVIEIIKKNNVEQVFSSEEERAIQSAQIIASAINKMPRRLPLLNERNWGEWQTKSWDEIKTSLEKMSLEERYTFIPPKGESWKQMEKRLQKALKLLISQKANAIAVITHGGTLRGLMPILTNSPIETSFRYDFENASVTIFDYLKNEFRKVLVNDTSHLK